MTNALSIVKKLESIIDMFDDLDLTYMIISETWLTAGPELIKIVDFLEGEGNIKMLNKIRRTRGGGISILYKPSKIQVKEFRFTRNGHEIIAAEGKVSGSSRPLLIVRVYAPPAMKKDKKDSLLHTICNLLTRFKDERRAPLFAISGDFNKIDTSRITTEHPTIKKDLSGPTRGNSALDITLTNTKNTVKIAGPLETKTGIESDHGTLIVTTELEDCHLFEWIQYTMRVVTEEGKRRFVGFLTNINWEEIMTPTICPHESTAILQKKLNNLTNMCFPWKSRKIKSDDDP